MSDERAQYDGDQLDEIVAEGVTLHIEQMDAHHWMIRAYRAVEKNPVDPDGEPLSPGVDIHLSGSDLFEVEDISGLPVISRPAVVYCHEWNDRSGRHHQCYERTGKHARHKCSCGATTRSGS
jgi:hypothetical protein